MTVRPEPRRGAAVIEMAMVCPVVVVMLFGLIVTGMGVFRFNMTAHLAREAARYASVRGDDYAQDTGKPAATQDSVVRDVVRPGAVGLDPAQLTATVVWDGGANKSARLVSPLGAVTTNYVTVTITYLWQPEVPFVPAVTLTSTSRIPVSQ